MDCPPHTGPNLEAVAAYISYLGRLQNFAFCLAALFDMGMHKPNEPVKVRIMVVSVYPGRFDGLRQKPIVL